MNKTSLIVVLTTIVFLALASQPALAQTTVKNEDAKLLASDGARGDNFGISADIDGDTAVVGAAAKDNDEQGTDSGAIYVFVRDRSGAWIEQAKLVASDGAPRDRFGGAVALDGDTIVVGARLDNTVLGADSGSVYVFTRDEEGTWGEQAKLTARDGDTGDQFGQSVALSGDTAVIGSWYDNDLGTLSGSVYVFTRDSFGIWTQQAKLLASDGTTSDRFGMSVDVDGDTAIVGASGSAYVFIRSGSGTWTQQAKLLAKDGSEDDSFGFSVDVDGDNAIIGAPFDDDNGDRSGSAYVFTRDSAGIWVQQEKLVADDGQANVYFGWSVALEGHTAAVSAHFDSTGFYRNGAVYVFKRSGGTWSEVLKLLASDRASGDNMGYYDAVGLSGGATVAGAYRDDNNGTTSGSAYVFEVDMVTDVSIDIRPFSRNNKIVPWARGLVPVAILGSIDFDALQVDPVSLEFGPRGAAPVQWKLWSRDVNRDSYVDLVVLFRTHEAGIECDATEATLRGHTFLMESIEGTDSIEIVGCKNPKARKKRKNK